MTNGYFENRPSQVALRENQIGNVISGITNDRHLKHQDANSWDV
jgi:hypothetical protein